MNNKEEEYLEHLIRKIKRNQQQPQNPQVSELSVEELRSELADLKQRYQQQSDYILKANQTQNTSNALDCLKQENMLLFQANLDLRLFIKELQNQISSQQGKKRTAKGKNAYKSSKISLEDENAKKQMELQGEMLSQKELEIQSLKKTKGMLEGQLTALNEKVLGLEREKSVNKTQLEHQKLKENFDLVLDKNQKLMKEAKDWKTEQEMQAVQLEKKQ